MPTPSTGISAAEVRTVAKLARLDLTDAQVEQYRGQLSAVLDHMQRIQRLDLAGVEPMTQPMETTGRLAEDVAGPVLTTASLMGMAPDKAEPFVKVPKVLGESSGA